MRFHDSLRLVHGGLLGLALTLAACKAPAPEPKAATPAPQPPPLSEQITALPAAERVALMGELEASLPRQKDVIVAKGKPLTLIGTAPEVGDAAPDFTLYGADGSTVRLEERLGKGLLLSVVPSLDTAVCEAQTGHFSAAKAELPEGVSLLTVSRDTPPAQKRFIGTHGETALASDVGDGDFGRNWGLVVEEKGLLARSVWVIDAGGRITYRQIVPDMTTEPDYEAALAAVRALGGEKAGD